MCIRDSITNVTIGRESEGSTYYSVNITLNSQGAKAFADASRDLVADHGKIVIILDGEVQSAPAVQSEIPNGEVSITCLLYTSPVLEALRHLEGIFPFLPRPYHVSTTSHAKRPLSEAICHLVVRMPKGKDFCRVESGVFVSCPELCFVRLAQSLPFHELVRAGNVLCGRFYLDAGKGGELGQREPLTSKRRIEAFLRACLLSTSAVRNLMNMVIFQSHHQK